MLRAARFDEQRLNGNPPEISGIDQTAPGIPQDSKPETGPSQLNALEGVMTNYTVTFENGEQAHITSDSACHALDLAEARFGIHAVYAELNEDDAARRKAHDELALAEMEEGIYDKVDDRNSNESEFDRINHGPFEHPVSE